MWLPKRYEQETGEAGSGSINGATTPKRTWARKMPQRKSKLCRYKYHSTQKNTHKCQSVPVIVPIQIDTTPSLNSSAANRKSTKMGLALDLGLSHKRNAASEHNCKRERDWILNSQDKNYITTPNSDLRKSKR